MNSSVNVHNLLIIVILGICLVESSLANEVLLREPPIKLTEQSSPDELEHARRAAALGNTEAALQLWGYHSSMNGMSKDGLFWVRLAAEQGDCVAVFYFAKQVVSLGQDYVTGREWLDRFVRTNCKTMPISDPKVQGAVAKLRSRIDEKLARFGDRCRYCGVYGERNRQGKWPDSEVDESCRENLAPTVL